MLALRLSAEWHLCILAWYHIHIHHFAGPPAPTTVLPHLILHLLLTFVTSLPHPMAREEQLLIPIPSPSLQDDMHRVIDRQLMDTHLKEQSQPAAAFSRGHGEGRGQEHSTMDGKRLFSFFRKI